MTAAEKHPSWDLYIGLNLLIIWGNLDFTFEKPNGAEILGDMVVKITFEIKLHAMLFMFLKSSVISEVFQYFRPNQQHIFEVLQQI